MKPWGALLLAALGCARDFAVPAPAQRPVITSYAPTSAFSQAILTIKGQNFDPVAANNVVQFEGSATRASAVTPEGDLQVYVPDATLGDDLSGPISVSNKNGVSDQSADQFVFLGRGHPFLDALVGTTKFLNRPPGIAVLAGETLVASTVTWSVMGANGFFAQLPGEPTALAGLPDGSAVFAAAGGVVSSAAAGGPSIDLGTMEVRFLAASLDSTRLVALGVDRVGVAHVIGLSPADLTKIGDQPVSGAVLGLAALNDGRAALSQAGGVSFVDPATGAATSQAAPAALSGALAETSAGLAAAFADGAVRVLASGAWSAAYSTGSPEPFATMASDGAALAGAKLLGRTVRLMDTSGGLIGEHVFEGRPHALFWGSGAPQVLVADDETNTADAIRATDGSLARHFAFPLGLGSSMGCGQGAAVEEDVLPGHYNYRMLVPQARGNQLASIDYDSLVARPPIPLAAGSSPVRGVAMPGVHHVFVVHDVEIGELNDDDSESILTSALPGTQCLLFADADASAVVALGAREASVLRGSTVTGSATMPGPIVSGAFRPDGKVLIFYGDAAKPLASPQARLYTLDALEHGGAPSAQFGGASQYQGFIGAFFTAWGPMLFFTWDAEANLPGSYAVVLDDSLAPKAAVDAVVPQAGVVRMTPDGYFIVWMRKDSPDDLLRIESAYDLNGIYNYEAYRLDGLPVAPAFDSSGEFMYVPVPELDEIQTFQ